jgi:hypothetical protein
MATGACRASTKPERRFLPNDTATTGKEFIISTHLSAKRGVSNRERDRVLSSVVNTLVSRIMDGTLDKTPAEPAAVVPSPTMESNTERDTTPAATEQGDGPRTGF